jgi:pyruvate dehydrogenase kinase 2/3/4
VSDEGGGIPRSGMPRVWTYMYTTAKLPSAAEDDLRSDFKAPMAGFGYGLPLSRLVRTFSWFQRAGGRTAPDRG